MRTAMTFFTATLMLTLTAGAQAAACSVQAAPGAKVQFNGTPLAGAKPLNPCEGEVVVEQGEAAACYKNVLGTPECKAFKNGGRFDLAQLKTGKANRDLFTRVANAYNGVRASETMEGGRKAFGADVRPGLPAGEIVMPGGNLMLSPNVAETGPWQQFEVIENGKVVFKQVQVSGVMSLPQALLKPGATYIWQARSAQAGALNGEFSLMSAERAAKLQDKLQVAMAQADSEFSGRLVRAMVYDGFGLAWDRDQLLNPVRE